MKVKGLEIFPYVVSTLPNSPKSQVMIFATKDQCTSITVITKPLRSSVVDSVSNLPFDEKDAQKVFERVIKFAEREYVETAIRFAIRNRQMRLAYEFADLVDLSENVIVLKNKTSYYVKAYRDGLWIEVLKITRRGNYKVHPDFRLRLVIASKQIYYSVFE